MAELNEAESTKVLKEKQKMKRKNGEKPHKKGG